MLSATKKKEDSNTNNNNDSDDSKHNKDETEKKEKPNKQPSTLIDLVFILDCTGSMSCYIQSARDNINQIAETISQEDDINVQFALICYRDIPPEDKTFITKITDFTPYPIKIQVELKKTRAAGGGDGPEALSSAFNECFNLKWRPNSTRIVVVISDAPPHGLETKERDGFPNGDPAHPAAAKANTTNNTNESKDENEGGEGQSTQYLNAIEILQRIRDSLQAVIYSIGCEPDLSCNFDFAREFLEYVAKMSNGKYFALSDAKLLPKVIVGSVKHQIAIDRLANRLDEEMQAIRDEHGDDISVKRMNELLQKKWKSEGVTKQEISCGTLYRKDRPQFNVNLLMNEQKVKSFKDFQKHCKMQTRMTRSDFRHLNVSSTKSKKPAATTDIAFTAAWGDDDDDDDDDDECVSWGDYGGHHAMRARCADSDSDDDDGLLEFAPVSGVLGDGADFCAIPTAASRPVTFIDNLHYDEDDDDDDNDLSDSCASQHFYENEESLSCGAVNAVMNRYAQTNNVVLPVEELDFNDLDLNS